jgi:putative ABC transport system permease protein
MWQIKLALRSLYSAKVRSTLTIIGVIIGVSLIVITMVVSSSAFAWMNSTVFGRGTNIIELTIGSQNSVGGFSIDPLVPVFGNDTVQALRSVAGIVAVYPSGMVDHFELVNGEAKSLISIPIEFVDPAFLSTAGVHLQNGSLVSDGIILSADTARLLNSTLGENLTVSVPDILTNVTYPVVAVFTTSNSAFGNLFISDVYLPISAWHGPYTVIFVEAASISDITNVQSNVLKVATQNATVSTVGMSIDAFSLQSLFSGSVSLYTTLLNFFLLFGLLALAIGGIGVSNVMLMKLKESVREIGILKSWGASDRAILALYLVEAMFVGLLGGLIGLAAGLLFSVAILHYFLAISLSPSVLDIVIGPLAGAAIGVTFGAYPAIKAYRMTPGEAARWEW